MLRATEIISFILDFYILSMERKASTTKKKNEYIHMLKIDH